jgi:flagellar biosynthesis protein FlhF
MQIKTFQANDMAEALRLVKAEFGPDAMILSSKKMKRGGFLGFFTKSYFEVTALLDNRPRADFSEPEPVREPVKQSNTMEEFQKSMLGPLAREIKELRSRVETLSQPEEKPAAAPVARKVAEPETQLVAEPRPGIEELKRFLMRSLDAEKGLDQAAGLTSDARTGKESAQVTELRSDIEELKQIVLQSLGVRKESEAVVPLPTVKTGASDKRSDAHREADELKQMLLRASGKELLKGNAPLGLSTAQPLSGSGTAFRSETALQDFPSLVLEGESISNSFGAVPRADKSPCLELGSAADELKHALHRFLNTDSTETENVRQPQPQTGPLSSELSQFDAMRELLRDNGVGTDAVETLLKPLIAAAEGEKSLDQIRGRLRDVITESVTCSKQMTLSNNSPRILALIGPTGVGKTTTIAKLAAFAMKQKVRVGIITIDTYRIGAVDQLKAYAAIMGLPLAVADTPEALAAAIKANSDKHLIFIDTAGRNPRDQERLLEMKTFLDVDPGIETHLCLAATTRDREQMHIFERFSVLPISRVLFTKLDESESFGCIINMHLKNRVPLSYFSNGQRVPEDLLVATPQRVADLVLGEMTP